MNRKKLLIAFTLLFSIVLFIQGCFEKPKAEPALGGVTVLEWENNSLNGILKIKLANNIGAKIKSYHIDYYENVDSTKITEMEKQTNTTLDPSVENEVEVVLVDKDLVFNYIKYLKIIYCALTVNIEDNNGNTYQIKKSIKIDRSAQVKTIEVKSIKISEKGEEAEFKGGYIITKDLRPVINIAFTEGVTLEKITTSSKAITIEKKASIGEDTDAAKTTSISIFASGTANTVAITLNNDLTTNSSFRLTVKGTPSGIRGTNGEILLSDYILEFEVRLQGETKVTYMDVVKVALTERAVDSENDIEQELKPIGNEVKNSLKARLKIEVNAPIRLLNNPDKLKENIKLIDLSDANREINFMPNFITSQEISLPLLEELKDGHSYELRVFNGIVGDNGEVFKENRYVYPFIVKLNNLKILSTLPMSGVTATEILNKTVIKFNKSIDMESVGTNQAIQVLENGVDISNNVTFEHPDDNTVEANWQFKNEKEYKVIVQGVTDLFENKVIFKEIKFSTVKLDTVTTAAVYLEMTAAEIRENESFLDSKILSGYIIENNLKPEITLSFSGNTDKKTITSGTIRLENLTNNTIVSISTPAAFANKIIFKPMEKLADASIYRLSIDSSIKGENNEDMKKVYVQEFLTKLIPLKITETSFFNNASSVSLTNVFAIKFNKEINQELLSANIENNIKVYEESIDISKIVKVVFDSPMTITTEWLFKENTTYTVEIKNVEDIYGNNTETKSYKFTTQKTEAGVTSASVYIDVDYAKIKENMMSGEQYNLSSYVVKNNLTPEIEIGFTANTDKTTTTLGAFILEDITNISSVLPVVLKSPIGFAEKVIVKPSVPLLDGHVYRLRVTKLIKGMEKEELKKEYIAEFRTEVDYLKVETTSPINSTSGIGTLEKAVIYFSKRIKKDSIVLGVGTTASISVLENGVNISDQITQAIADDLKSVEFRTTFKLGRKYTILMKVNGDAQKGITDEYGNGLMGENNLDFTMKDDTTIVNYFEPIAINIKEKDVAKEFVQGYNLIDNLLPEINIEFTKGVILNKSTITSGTIVLEDITTATTTVAILTPASYSVANMLKIIPEVKLADNHSYRVRVLRGIEGLNGESLKENEYRYEFSTAINYPKVLKSLPISGSTGIDLVHKVIIDLTKEINTTTITTSTVIVTETDIDTKVQTTVTGISFNFESSLMSMSCGWTFSKGKKYTITFNGIEDLYGNKMILDTISFTTLKETQSMLIPTPINLNAISGVDSVSLTWEKPVTTDFSIIGYGIYAGTESDKLYKLNTGSATGKPNVEFATSIIIRTGITYGSTTTGAIGTITSGAVYYFKVTAFTEGGVESSPGNITSSYVFNGSAPVLMQNEINTNMGYYVSNSVTVAGIKLEWQNKTGVTDYLIYKSSNLATGPFVKIKEVEASTGLTSSYTDTVLPGMQVWYKISCKTAQGEGVQSGAVTVKDEEPPAKPEGIVAKGNNGYIIKFDGTSTATNDIKLYLSWTPNTERDLAGYKIYISDKADGGYKLIKKTAYTSGVVIDPRVIDSSVDTLTPATGYYSNSNPVGVGEYYLRVTSYDQTGNESLQSEYIHVKNGALLTVSNFAGGKIVEVIDDRYLTRTLLSWAKLQGEIENYVIYRMEGNMWFRVGEVDGASESYKDTTVEVDKIYNYNILAIDKYNNTGDILATPIIISTKANQVVTVPEPLNTLAVAGVNSITLTWEKPETTDFNIIGYNVYIGTDKDNLYQINNGKTPNVEFTTNMIIQRGDVYTTTAGAVAVETGNTYYFKVSSYTEKSEESIKGSLTSAYVYNGSAPIIMQSEISANLGYYYDVLTSTTVAGVRLEWQNKGIGAGVTGYKVYKSISQASGPFVKIKDIIENTSPTSIFIDTAMPGTQVWYRISCDTANGEGVQSGSVTAKDETTPAKPEELVAKANNGYTVSANGTASSTNDKNLYLSWKANAERDLAGYKIYISDNSDTGYRLIKKTAFNSSVVVDPTKFDISVDSNQSSTGFYSTATPSGTGNYYIKVTAYDQTGNESLQSAYVAVRNITLTAVQNVSGGNIVEDSTAKSYLTWTKLLGDIGGYVIYRMEGATNIWFPIATVLATENSYKDSAVVTGTTYHYKVMGVDIYNNTGTLSSPQVDITIP